MLDTITRIKKLATESITRAGDSKTLEKLRVRYLGRKGELTRVLRGLKDLPLDLRRRVGPEANRVRGELDELLRRKLELLAAQAPRASLIDVTRPGTRVARGHAHPLRILDEEIRRIFLSLNFSVVEGSEVETDYYNFDALNIPPDHPARDMWDTFWLRQDGTKNQNPKLRAGRDAGKKNDRLLLRTHTSPMQIRYMETHEPPFQIIVPGRVFRYEALDFSHEINFHQVEGLMVGHEVSLANFKYVIEAFFKKLFPQKIAFRFRPSYFPFVEPGLEVDIRLTGGMGRLRRASEWLEVMGAGMVHPNVLRAVKYDPYAWQGFAFGMGLERLAMIKYGIPDIRLFYASDLRFIEQF